MGKEIKLGSFVKDILTGVTGTVIAKTQWLYGCERVIVQPCEKKDGRPVDSFVVDEKHVALSGKTPLIDEIEVDLDSRVNLGDRARDNISRLSGIVVAKTYWLEGGMRITIQPEELFEGKPLGNCTFDEPQVTVTEKGVFEPLSNKPIELAVPDTDEQGTAKAAQAPSPPPYGDDLPGPTRHPDPER